MTFFFWGEHGASIRPGALKAHVHLRVEIQAQQLRGVALADAQAQAILAVEYDHGLAGRARLRSAGARPRTTSRPKCTAEWPAVAHGLHRRARNVGNQVAVVVDVRDVAR